MGTLEIKVTTRCKECFRKLQHEIEQDSGIIHVEPCKECITKSKDS